MSIKTCKRGGEGVARVLDTGAQNHTKQIFTQRFSVSNTNCNESVNNINRGGGGRKRGLRSTRNMGVSVKTM
jgi:hypothetical protein